MALDPSLDAALQGEAPTLCCLMRITLPSWTIRLVDGSAEIPFEGQTYRGSDAVYGALNAVESVVEQIGTEAPRVRFTFLPDNLDALADITSPISQGSEVMMWAGAVNPATGLLIGTPELLFYGELDSAEIDFSATNTVITMDVASAWERLFEANEGNRLNNAFHQSLWPGELGFEFVPQVGRAEPWGYDAARPAVVRDVISGRPGNALLRAAA